MFPAEANTNHHAHTNLLMRLLNGESPPTITLEQVQGYLRDNHRSVESLLGAFHVTHDKSLLAEAKEKFPNDPQVNFAAATQPTDSPEEHRKWLDSFKKIAPDNALANYLSASDYFKTGQAEQALQEVQTAAGKSIQDYELDSLQNAQEAYQAAGYSDVDAQTIASSELLLPEMGAYKSVGVALVDQAKSYQQTGDTASAQASLQLAMDLGQRVDDPGSPTLIQPLVGMAVQKIALSAMDPNAVYGDDNQTVQSQLDALAQQRAGIRTLNQQWTATVPQMTDQDLENYYERKSHFGEQSAMQWAITKYSQPQ
jgi:tetratricopeptide (TPR) repeat protein